MHSFQEGPLMPMASIRAISGWEVFLDDGKRYLKTAGAAHSKGRVFFTPAILYNIIAMAIEKFVMAVLMRHGTMPNNHTITDLVEAMDLTFPGAIADIRAGLLNLDGYQDICDPYEFTVIPPDIKDIPFMLELAGRLLELVEKQLSARRCGDDD